MRLLAQWHAKAATDAADRAANRPWATDDPMDVPGSLFFFVLHRLLRA